MENFNIKCVYSWNFTQKNETTPSLESALDFFAKSGCVFFGNLPYEIIWHIFSIKQKIEIDYLLKYVNTKLLNFHGLITLFRVTKNREFIIDNYFRKRLRLKLTPESFHPRERFFGNLLTGVNIKKLFDEFSDLI